jgi:tetratricopeptide (TPR) repeat protein
MLRRKLGRGPLTAALFFVGTLVPALGFVNVFPMQYSFVADHFQYIAGIGPIVLAVAIFWKKAPRDICIVLLSLLVVCLCIVSIARCQVYHDRISLWEDANLKNPDGIVVHLNLGRAFLFAGQTDEAEAQGWKLIALDPASPARGQVLIGQCMISRGDYQQAAHFFGLAQQSQPDFTDPLLHAATYTPYFLQATAYASLADQIQARDPTGAAHDRDLAIADYQQALGLNQQDEWCFVNFAVLLTDVGRTQDAIDQCHQALKLNPLSIPAYICIGNANFKQRNLDAALDAYHHVLGIQHDNLQAIANIGQVYGAQGKWDRAIGAFKAALQINPDFEPARRGLEAAIRSQGEKN